MRFSLLQPLGDIPLAFVDVETTGASARWGDRIIEIGIVRLQGGKSVGQYQQLIDPGRKLSPAITALTGITQTMLDGQPTFADQMEAMLPWLSDAMVLGHNVPFDLSFLVSEFQRCRLQLGSMLDGAPIADTLRLARRRFGRGGNSLQPLARRLGVTPSVAHRALGDAQTTAKVFEQLIEPVGGWNCMLCDLIREQGGPMRLSSAEASADPLPLELQDAIERGRPVVMEYLDSADRRTRRTIHPLQIRRQGGELILIAYCQLRRAQRTFKVRRIVRLISDES